MHKILALITFLSIQMIAYCCGNENYTALTEIPLKNGRIDLEKLLHLNEVGDSQEFPYWTYDFRDDLVKREFDLKEKMKKDKDYKLLSDYTWVSIKLGKAREMIPILDSLHKKYPKDYNIAANLGTAYELVGYNTKALEFIQKAVAINPSSHFGSEWIHINLLKEKMKMSTDFEQII
jgi:tetratricopeptide (TPR) repeat protein